MKPMPHSSFTCTEAPAKAMTMKPRCKNRALTPLPIGFGTTNAKPSCSYRNAPQTRLGWAQPKKCWLL